MTIRGQSNGLVARLRRWSSARRELRNEIDILSALDQLNDHLLRDIGMRRNRPTGSRFTPDRM
jgi:uncharacterized protein YjiS (DUF1127 family)